MEFGNFGNYAKEKIEDNRRVKKSIQQNPYGYDHKKSQTKGIVIKLQEVSRKPQMGTHFRAAIHGKNLF